MIKKILVTGGFGFIGSHLVEQLLKDSDCSVHVVDNLVTSPIDYKIFVNRINQPERLTFDICSVQEYFGRENLPKINEIYHLASVVGPVGVLKHGGQIVREMVSDNYAIADYALKMKCKVCDISTSEVYGGGRDGYCCENDSMIIPPKISVRLEYAVGKLACEVALMNMARINGLNVRIVRPFNVAGPRQSPAGGFVLPRFIQQALSGESLTVYSDGSMIRAFTHVQDIADGIIRAMKKGKAGTVYNMGNPANKISILDLAREVVKQLSSRSEIIFVDPKELWGPLFEEANDKYPDADRAINDLGWHPEFQLPETILDTARYIKEERCD